MTIDLDVLASRLMPVTTHDTPDYAEVSFGDVKSQTMTMEPEIFLMLNALPDLIAAARERDALREALRAFISWGEQQCPCHDDKPNPCPLCDASIENLEGCKAVEKKFPPRILALARQALKTGDQS